MLDTVINSKTTTMKYTLLTKEQFEALHVEFSQFLASQKIDKALWESYKKTNNKIVAEELAIFSDLVWDDVLSKVNYLEETTTNELHLYKVEKTAIQLFIVQTTTKHDLSTEEGITWLIKNLNDNSVQLTKGTKKISVANRNKALFDIIQKGAQITDGKLYEMVFEIINTQIH